MADNDFKTSGEVATIQPTFEGEGTHTQGEDTANKHTSTEPTAVTVHRGMEVEPQPPNRGSRKQNRGSVDGGIRAWVIVMAASIMHSIIAGFVLAQGVLYVEWQEEFSVGAARVSWIGSAILLAALCVGNNDIP